MVKIFDQSIKGLVELYYKEREQNLQEKEETPVGNMKD